MEWNKDWKDPGYYLESPYEDPQGPAEGGAKVVRGGSWATMPFNIQQLYTYNRGSQEPDFELSGLGFRCAKNSTED